MYWFLQLNIECSCSPVWDERKPSSTGVWNQVSHRLLWVRQHYSDCQTWEGERDDVQVCHCSVGWLNGMFELPSQRKWTCSGFFPPRYLKHDWVSQCQATHTSSLSHTHTLHFTVHPPNQKLHSFTSLFHFPLCPTPILVLISAQPPSLLAFHPTIIYVSILNPQSLGKYYRLLHNPWKVRDTSDCISNHTPWRSGLQVQQLSSWFQSAHCHLMVQFVCDPEGTPTMKCSPQYVRHDIS